jgi:hypothetical protein
MNCPQCDGPTYDNRQKVEDGWRGPLFKCKDKDGCGWVKWPPKGKSSGGNGGGRGGNAGSTRSTRPLGPLYFACYKIAAATLFQELKKIGITPTAADVTAAAATLMIAATNTGAPLAAPKPAPKPEPEPEQEYDDAADFNADSDPSGGKLPF